LLAFRYSFDVPFDKTMLSVFAAVGDKKTSQKTGHTAGAINGRLYSMSAGVGHCFMMPAASFSPPTGEPLKTDLRQEKSITLDDGRIVKIRRRKIQLRLPDELDALIAYLTRIDDDAVLVRSDDRKPTIDQLVRMLSEGGGASDWAEEQLYELGEQGEEALVAKLNDPKWSKYHGRIAFALLTVFRSNSARSAVERRIAAEPDEEQQKELLALLLATRSR